MPSQPLRLSQGMGGGGGGGGGGCRVYCNFHWNAGVGEVHFNIPLGSCTIFIVGVEVGVGGGGVVECTVIFTGMLGWVRYILIFHWVAVLFS